MTVNTSVNVFLDVSADSGGGGCGCGCSNDVAVAADDE